MSRYILVVEDEPAIRFVYQEYLADLGFPVRAAENGESALGVKGQPAPSLALVDLNLPGMSGVEVIRALNGLHPRMPVVVISANPRARQEVARAAVRVEGILEKPIDLEQLGVLARRYLG